MKLVNFQLAYPIDDAAYKWVAVNKNGNVVCFKNAPVRDYEYGEWIDSTDGTTGELILFEKWENSVRTTAELTDLVSNAVGMIKNREALKNAGTYKNKKEKKSK